MRVLHQTARRFIKIRMQAVGGELHVLSHRRTPIHSSYRMSTTITSIIGSRAPTANAKMLNAASLLMMYLIAAQRELLSVKFYARGTTLFPARIAARLFVAPWAVRRFASRRPAQLPVIASLCLVPL